MIDSRTSLPETDGRAGGVLVYGIAALLWTIVLGIVVGAAASRVWIGLLWGISAAALWFASLRDHEAPLARTAFFWWLRSLVAPVIVLLELIEGRSRVEAIEADVARLKRQVRVLQGARIAPDAPEGPAAREEATPAPAVARPTPEPERAAAAPPKPADGRRASTRCCESRMRSTASSWSS